MEKLSIANKRLKTARDDQGREYDAQIKKLDDKENLLTARLSELEKKKLETALANGNEDAADDDLVQVNAGGKIISAKRSTLTQLKGTRFEALFSGRWDKKLQRDSNGRIFLDVNPLCFQAIVDYLNEMAISSDDNPPDPPSVADELKRILKHQLELFELETVPAVSMPDSTIIQDESHVTQLHDWLKEGGDSDVELSLLYRGSRDGLSSSHAFHSKCDNQGCTLTIIQTTGDMVFGGYSNTPWKSNRNAYASANKAFLFGLSGGSASSTDNFFPCKMKLRDGYANDANAIYRTSNSGPTFGSGNDLHVRGSSVHLNIGESYESDPTGQLSGSHQVKEIEVFKVIPTAQKPASTNTKLSSIEQVANFSKKINAAINAKWASLGEADDELLKLEDSFKDEGTFMSFFANGKPQDVVTLNVCGTIMVTRRQTLQLCKESALASNDQQESQSHDHSDIKEWNHEDVVAWLNRLEISESVVKEFEDNQVT
ncbi:LOW QUALITY PROTEIN: hypothetical protein ACHAXR_004090, partial [Thalassiosira sp. AJA248-18]